MREKRPVAYVAVWMSIIVNVIIFLIKLWIGIKSNSVAMMADAWHSMSDSFTSIVILIGLWLSARPADERHPFGHGRAESVGCVVVATLLAVVGFNFLEEAVVKLRTGGSAEFSMMAIMIFAFTILIYGLSFV